MNTATEERPSRASLQALFNRQRHYVRELSLTTARQRKAKLQRMLDYLLRQSEALEKAISDDVRKSRVEINLSELAVLTAELRYHIRHLDKWMRPHRVPATLLTTGTSSYIQYEAKGTSLIISPWNYPVSLALKPLIAAISAGCTAIIKPSEFTPHAAAFIRQLAEDLFIPEEVAVVEGGPEEAATLLDFPFDHIFFTGSTKIGKLVMAAAARHLSSVSLELGGKSPAVVDQTADIRAAARNIAWAKFFNNGQTCIAPDYVLVHEQVKERFLTEIEKAVSQMYLAERKDAQQSESYARIISPGHYHSLVSLLENAVRDGAGIVFGGQKDESDLFISPTLLTGVTPEMEIMHREIFGPLLPVLFFESLEEAVALIQGKEKPLGLYIFSRNSKDTDYVLKRTSSGNAVVNDTLIQFMHAEIPFGGTGPSGTGKANGFFGFQEFSNAKGVIRRKFGSFAFLYPPYTDRTLKILKLIQKYL